MGANWFDVVWAVALVYGVVSGIRTGLLSEIGRLVSWGLITWLSLTFYVPLRRLDQKLPAGVDAEPARLTAYLLLVICVFMISLIIRRIIYKLTRKKTIGTVFTPECRRRAGWGDARDDGDDLCPRSGCHCSAAHSGIGMSPMNRSSARWWCSNCRMVAAVVNKPFKEEFIFFRDVQRLAGIPTPQLWDDVEMIEFRTNKPAKPH